MLTQRWPEKTLSLSRERQGTRVKLVCPITQQGSNQFRRWTLTCANPPNARIYHRLEHGASLLSNDQSHGQVKVEAQAGERLNYRVR